MRGRLVAVAVAALVASLVVQGGSAQQLLSAKLTVTKSAPSLIDSHDKFSYKITVKNDGDVSLYYVAFQDQLPDQVSFIKVESDPDLQCSEKAKLVTCVPTAQTRSPFLAAGASQSATISVQDLVEGPATIRNTVDANSRRPALKASDTETTTVAAGDVAVTKTGPATATVDDVVPYTITVTNKGPNRARDVTLTDSLPALLADVSAPGCTVAGNDVTCGFGELASGDTKTVQVAARAAADGTAIDRATVTSSTTDPDHGNNIADATTTIVKKPPPPPKPVDLAIAMTVTPASVQAGAHVSYRIVVTNRGPGSAPATVTDKLPGAMRFVSATKPCTQKAGIVRCKLGTLAAGKSTKPIVIGARAVGAGKVTNEADVSGSRDPVPANDVARATALVGRPTRTTPTHTTPTPTVPTPTHSTPTATTPTTSTATTTTPPPEQTAPKLALSPAVGPPGSITHATGRGFPPGATVRLEWSKGLGSATVTANERGRFTLSLLVFHSDVLGPRRLVASPGAGSPPYDPVGARFLVALRALQPTEFD